MRSCLAYNPQNSQFRSVFVSVLFHGALLLVLLSIPSHKLEAPVIEKSIKVEVISFEVLKALQIANPNTDQPRADAKPSTPSAKSAYGTLIRPSTMLSAAALARDDNAEARSDLAGVTPDEQREQLCAFEALEQIQAWNDKYVPQRMVSYSFADVRVEGSRLIADGATFWSKGNWHRLKFECEVSADLEKVLDFAFLVGVIVPKDQWERYNLTKYK